MINQIRDLYPEEWPEIRARVIEAAGNKCEHCGIEQHTLVTSRRGVPYIIYLHAAHKNPLETYNPSAPMIALCSPCHRKRDRSNRRIYHKPLPFAEARLFIANHLAHIAQSYESLRYFLATLQAGETFEIQIQVNGAIVGNGRYTVKAPGRIIKRSEHGACAGLAAQIQNVHARHILS